MEDSIEKVYLVAFSAVPGIGPARVKLLRDYFGSYESAWKAPEEKLVTIGLPSDVLHEFLAQRRVLEVEKYVESLQKKGIQFVTVLDPNYPQRLRNIPSPPLVLFIKSNLTLDQFNDLTTRKVIGVVGTRKVTSYGADVTRNLTEELVTAGFIIVSGMALGVDGIAHGAAINAGGKTIAVLGAGVEVIYPQAHRELYQSILDHDGAIVSEVAPDKRVVRGIFPARNRIISGLSEGVLVTEGAIDSGSLITARAALEQGREVFAVPGPISSPLAEGTNYLLKQGAKLVTNINDILETLGYEGKTVSHSQIPHGDNEDEQMIIDFLINEPMEFDELVKRSGWAPAKLGSLLSIMEIKGKLKNADLTYRLDL